MKNTLFILSALVLILTADCTPSRHIADLPKRALNIGAETSASKSYPAKTTRIAHKEVVLEIPAGALKAPVDVKIEELVQVESLDPGMKNITQGASGYRFLPDGLTFEKKVTLTVPYDRSKIASEAELAYLYTYFYNHSCPVFEKKNKKSH